MPKRYPHQQRDSYHEPTEPKVPNIMVSTTIAILAIVVISGGIVYFILH